MEKKADRTIITVVGKDTVGIIAGVCTYLADNGINVLDISQTIVQGFFQHDDDCGHEGRCKTIWAVCKRAGRSREKNWRCN